MKRLLFMHIHKTAGTALASQLFASYPECEICPDRFEWQVIAAHPDMLRRYRIFHGHITPAALRPVGDGLECITMLREPRVRLLSAFFYWKNGAHGANLQNAFFRRIVGMSLEDFLRSDDALIRQATWNVQARLIAGGRYGATDDHRTNVLGPEWSAAEIARAALANIDRFMVIGITEQYPATLRAACAALGRNPAPLPERHNEGLQVPEGGYASLLADRQIAALLDSRTDIDMRIYDAARARLAGAVA